MSFCSFETPMSATELLDSYIEEFEKTSTIKLKRSSKEVIASDFSQLPAPPVLKKDLATRGDDVIEYKGKVYTSATQALNHYIKDYDGTSVSTLSDDAFKLLTDDVHASSNASSAGGDNHQCSVANASQAMGSTDPLVHSLEKDIGSLKQRLNQSYERLRVEDSKRKQVNKYLKESEKIMAKLCAPPVPSTLPSITDMKSAGSDVSSIDSTTEALIRASAIPLPRHVQLAQHTLHQPASTTTAQEDTIAKLKSLRNSMTQMTKEIQQENYPEMVEKGIKERALKQCLNDGGNIRHASAGMASVPITSTPHKTRTTSPDAVHFNTSTGDTLSAISSGGGSSGCGGEWGHTHEGSGGFDDISYYRLRSASLPQALSDRDRSLFVQRLLQDIDDTPSTVLSHNSNLSLSESNILEGCDYASRVQQLLKGSKVDAKAWRSLERDDLSDIHSSVSQHDISKSYQAACQPARVEALKHMIFALQAITPPESTRGTPECTAQTPTPLIDNDTSVEQVEHCVSAGLHLLATSPDEAAGAESLNKAMEHLRNLKTIVAEQRSKAEQYRRVGQPKLCYP